MTEKTEICENASCVLLIEVVETYQKLRRVLVVVDDG